MTRPNTPRKPGVERTQPMAFQLIQRLLGLPRLTRILLAGVFALAVTFAVFPLVDGLYIQYLFAPETRILPSLISGGLGLAIYALGWWLMIGTVGETPPARLAILWYVGLGVFAILLVTGLTLFGLSMATAPTF